jgi:hypothetical protein
MRGLANAARLLGDNCLLLQAWTWQIGLAHAASKRMTAWRRKGDRRRTTLGFGMPISVWARGSIRLPSTSHCAGNIRLHSFATAISTWCFCLHQTFGQEQSLASLLLKLQRVDAGQPDVLCNCSTLAAGRTESQHAPDTQDGY